MMRWFTCTPVAFGGGEDFFARDSGLLSRGFRALGIESRAVMPEPGRPEDLAAELIRTRFENLEDAGWWRGQELDGVVLYAWGRPKFRGVAAAIRQAGISLVLNQDHGGLISPVCGLGEWWAEQRTLSGAGRVRGGWKEFGTRVAKGLGPGLLVSDRLRANHLAQGDWIAAVSPRAAELQRKFCRIYGGEELASRVTCVPHAVDPRFSFGGAVKERRVVSVGRWDDERQKRTSLLMAGLERLLGDDPAVEIDVVGTTSAELRSWREGSPHRERIRLHGRLEPAAMVPLLEKAQVAWCPSAFESFHIASAEALCCGCSVVAAESPSLAAFSWFTGEGDGRLVRCDDARGHAAALSAELGAWERGEREAEAIAARWSARLHAPQVARQILDLVASRDA